jgi:hypothetical protein
MTDEQIVSYISMAVFIGSMIITLGIAYTVVRLVRKGAAPVVFYEDPEEYKFASLNFPNGNVKVVGKL